MKLYQSLFRTRFNAGLQYRGAAIAGVLTQFVWGFLSIMLFSVLGQGKMNTHELSTYFWLRQAFLSLSAVWAMDSSIFSLIESGEVAYECTRPIDLYSLWYTRNLAHRLSRCALRFLPVLLVAFFLPYGYRLHLPASLYDLVMFLLSLMMTLCLVVAINMLMYVFTFYAKNALGIRVIFMGIFDLLDGSNIPYPFFSEIVQKGLSFTFFVGLQTSPIFIYLGVLEPIRTIFIQGIWLLILVVLGRFLMKRALNKIEVYGG